LFCGIFGFLLRRNKVGEVGSGADLQLCAKVKTSPQRAIRKRRANRAGFPRSKSDAYGE
jgi:hypothetical protein